MSLKIELNKVSKRYKNEWILRDISLALVDNQSYAVSGPNGSGKSTLLKLLSGFLTPSRGQIEFAFQNKAVDKEQIYQHLSFAAPYIDLIEELTLLEMIQFHSRFKTFQQDLSSKELISILGMKSSTHKMVKNFSSGMKQRLKLALAICTNSSILLLDEPTTNLDQQGMDWYLSLIDSYKQERLIIVASNIPADYNFCKHHIDITQFKPKKKK